MSSSSARSQTELLPPLSPSLLLLCLAFVFHQRSHLLLQSHQLSSNQYQLRHDPSDMNQPQAAPKRDHARSQSSKNLLNQGQKGSRRPSGQATRVPSLPFSTDFVLVLTARPLLISHALSRCQWQPTFAHLDEPQATGAHTKSKHTRCITNGYALTSLCLTSAGPVSLTASRGPLSCSGLGLGQGCRNRTKKTPVGHNTTIRTSRKAACVQAEADADKLAATSTVRLPLSLG